MYLILGFTKRTSYTLAKFLIKQQKTLLIADSQNTIEQQNLLQTLDGDIINELGSQTPDLLERYPIQKIFISPGVPRCIPLVQQALVKGIEILNDIEYFYCLFPTRTYIAVTGTDGKTTVVSWLGHVLSSAKPSLLVGNIGIPIFDYADEKYQDYLFIVELSSFQLESLSEFRPHIAVITNIHEDHLDRYDSMDDYIATKKKIFVNQRSEDWSLINKDDPTIVSFAEKLNASLFYFSCKELGDISLYEGHVYYKQERQFDVKNITLVGQHNIQNALIVFAVAVLLGIDSKLIGETLCSFRGVEHRLEFVGSYHGIKFYNDSKATTTQALALAVQSFPKKILLLAGGRSKGLDYGLIRETIANKVKKAFVFGELAEELTNSWDNIECLASFRLKEAFIQAISYAQEGDTIILSPGATSFDEFVSYEHRGMFFKDLINEYDLHKDILSE
ncbi:MAG: UDP-N-acetylmuramoyl-L-alanine--D-glutamate ligase [Brevinema sp.]